MIIFCPSNDDEHGAFPHRLVITSPRLTYQRKRGMAKGEWKVIPSQTFVICAICDHMVTRAVFGCICPQRCHDQARADLALAAQTGVS